MTLPIEGWVYLLDRGVHFVTDVVEDPRADSPACGAYGLVRHENGTYRRYFQVANLHPTREAALQHAVKDVTLQMMDLDVAKQALDELRAHYRSELTGILLDQLAVPA